MSVFEILISNLEVIEDPRVVGRVKHKLIDILVIGCLAIICHAETWIEMENFGKSKKKWLKKFLDLENGIPSHDTFGRVFSLVAPELLEEVFLNWLNQCRKTLGKDIICFDGKTSKGTIKSTLGQRRECLNIINAWSSVQGLCLGQMKASGTGNCETTAAKELLDVLEVKGSVISCDAGIGKSSFLTKVLAKGANYTTPLKGNPKVPYQRVLEEFSKYSEKKSRSKKVELIEETKTKHGRVERRSCTLIRESNFTKGLFRNENMNKDYYPGVRAIGRIIYEVEEKESRPYIQETTEIKNQVKRIRTSEERRNKRFEKYFITSLDGSIEEIYKTVRQHWSIENQLHWVLDISFGEDANRVRNKLVAQNLSLVRKIALNLAKQDKTKKMGMKAKLKLAGWDQDYLEHLLFKTELS